MCCSGSYAGSPTYGFGSITSHGSRSAPRMFSGVQVGEEQPLLGRRRRAARGRDPGRSRASPGSSVRSRPAPSYSSAHSAHICASGRNGWPTGGSTQSRRQQPGHHLVLLRLGTPGQQRGLPRTARAAGTTWCRPCRSDGPGRCRHRPTPAAPRARARSPCGGQPTLSTRSAPSAVRTGATHEQLPPGLEGRARHERPPVQHAVQRRGQLARATPTRRRRPRAARRPPGSRGSTRSGTGRSCPGHDRGDSQRRTMVNPPADTRHGHAARGLRRRRTDERGRSRRSARRWPGRCPGTDTDTCWSVVDARCAAARCRDRRRPARGGIPAARPSARPAAPRRRRSRSLSRSPRTGRAAGRPAASPAAAHRAPASRPAGRCRRTAPRPSTVSPARKVVTAVLPGCRSTTAMHQPAARPGRRPRDAVPPAGSAA